MKQRKLIGLAFLFEGQCRALRLFNERIGEAAEEEDARALSGFLFDLKGLFKLDIEDDFLEEVAKSPAIAQATNTLLIASLSRESATESDSSKSVAQLETVLKDADHPLYPKLEKLAKSLMDILLLPPSQTVLLRRSVLVNIACTWETVVSNLIREYYTRYPTSLPSERTLTLADIRSCASIEDAERRVLQTEIDHFLYDPFDKRMMYLRDKLHLDLSPIKQYYDELKEILLRRNVVVHNNGIVNRTYLDSVVSLGMTDPPEEGTPLPVPKEYLSKAIDTVFVAGVVLMQLCWAKWHRTETDEAAMMLVLHTYKALKDERFSLVESLGRFASEYCSFSDGMKKTLTINHAISLREQGKKDEMEGLLRSVDWSAASKKFQVALDVLYERYDQLEKSLSAAVETREISLRDIEEWPLFTSFRSTAKYTQIVGPLLERRPAESEDA